MVGDFISWICPNCGQAYHGEYTPVRNDESLKTSEMNECLRCGWRRPARRIV